MPGSAAIHAGLTKPLDIGGRDARFPASPLANPFRRENLKKILAVALLLATSAAFPIATPVFADSSTNPLCAPDAPEAYKRPGGYCEQLDQGSLVQSEKDCNYVIESMLATLKPGETILVADNCYYEVPVKL
jgi:hypothetical protein